MTMSQVDDPGMTRYEAFNHEWALAEQAALAEDWNLAENHYSRAHILGQPRIPLHLRAHAALFGLYIDQHRWRDAWGQAIRYVLVVPGTWLKRLPAGNSGLSNVSAFKPMAVPPDLAAIIHDDATRTRR
ncbi:MAG: DUF3703 domain-containing protein [Betaproteobacteria bacterium]|nr:DUF3703 domain-containing protein [Betaproteobacteria bacterium]